MGNGDSPDQACAALLVAGAVGETKGNKISESGQSVAEDSAKPDGSDPAEPNQVPEDAAAKPLPDPELPHAADDESG